MRTTRPEHTTERHGEMGKLKRHSLYGQVITRGNMLKAWRAVKANRGAAGVDRQSIEEFEKNLEGELERLFQELKAKTYQPQPVRRVYIPKANGARRPLGIPAVRDRVVQQALRQVLEPVFEPLFLECSFGFRPKKSAHMALDRVSAHLEEGYRWVVDCDIKGYFDSIPQEKLIDAVAEEVADGTVLRLIRAFLQAGVLEEGSYSESEAGTPQGGVISPLLANIYLHKLDAEMTKRGHRLTRYADDCAPRRLEAT
ncbi:MAG: group II intron reverse transcriptase/maturase [Bacillota bacterium]|nr:group II intron reverse transcriptase/maturase [Bacillota bacterium]